MTENEISKIVFDTGLEIHRKLVPGLFESVYETCLAHDLRKKGLNIQTQVNLPIIYDDLIIEKAFRLDMLIEGKIIIEVKAISEISDLHLAQILTYLKMTDLKLGMLINFNVNLFKDGVRRVVNGL